MALKIESIPVADFEEWCEAHGFDIVVKERSANDAAYTRARYHGELRKNGRAAEIMLSGILRSPCDNGDTVRAVIAAMALTYSEQRIAIGAYTKEREEMQLPRFTCKLQQVAPPHAR